MIALGEIKEGSKVLDLSTGVDEPAITAAQVVGKSGHIWAFNISTLMLAVAR